MKYVKPKTFEEATQRLNTLVAKMEGGELPLSEMIDAFEEGRQLVSYCNQCLAEVQHRVEIIKQKEAADTITREDGSALETQH